MWVSGWSADEGEAAVTPGAHVRGRGRLPAGSILSCQERIQPEEPRVGGSGHSPLTQTAPRDPERALGMGGVSYHHPREGLKSLKMNLKKPVWFERLGGVTTRVIVLPAKPPVRPNVFPAETRSRLGGQTLEFR